LIKKKVASRSCLIFSRSLSIFFQNLHFFSIDHYVTKYRNLSRQIIWISSMFALNKRELNINSEKQKEEKGQLEILINVNGLDQIFFLLKLLNQWMVIKKSWPIILSSYEIYIRNDTWLCSIDNKLSWFPQEKNKIKRNSHTSGLSEFLLFVCFDVIYHDAFNFIIETSQRTTELTKKNMNLLIIELVLVFFLL